VRKARTQPRWFAVWLPVCMCAALFGITTAAQEPLRPPSEHPLDLTRYALRLVYENSFSRPQKIAREEDFIEPAPGGAWRRKGRPASDAEWIAEGWGGCAVRDGRLWVAPSELGANGAPMPVEPGRRSHMVAWNRRIFPGDFLFELEMYRDDVP